MDSGFYGAFKGLAAETQALELAANNLANISTTGYKAQREFYKSLTASLGNTSPRPLSSLNQAINNYGVLGGATVDVQAGMMERTGKPSFCNRRFRYFITNSTRAPRRTCRTSHNLAGCSKTV